MKSSIETIRDEEQDSYDNLPESIQDRDRGQAMSDAIDNLDSADWVKLPSTKTMRPMVEWYWQKITTCGKLGVNAKRSGSG